ncbi:hypothetical protein M3221_18150 [Domibacillus indicus]|nr:hypothetical protein [Domibacillus indicus]MCM3790305.1 hypothetical protein [Domibacillus indicus]
MVMKVAKSLLHKILNQTEIFKEQKVCAVDLGLTNSAVCSIIDATGTSP